MYTRQLGRECGRYFQPLLLNDERADPLSMTSKAAFTTEEMGSEVERIDVGVQISPSKKQDACFSVGYIDEPNNIIIQSVLALLKVCK